MAYNGSVELISGIIQKNGGTFPLVDASAVRVTDNEKLDAALSNIIIVSETQPQAQSNKLWIEEGEEEEITVPTNTEFQAFKTEESLLCDELPGTSTTVTMDGNGNPTTIVHASNGTTVRTDTFTWGTNTVTEVRTLSSGKYITITTNLTTLAKTVSGILEVT